MKSIARVLILMLCVAIAACDSQQAATPAATPPQTSQSPAPLGDDALLEDLERRTFQYFWDTANSDNGLVPDRYPSPSFSSIAAVGFGLTAYVIGAERGYITREQARDRTLVTLRFFANAKQGAQSTGVSGHQGFFYHFIDMKDGHRYRDTELSTVDTALLLGGMLTSQSYFDRAGEEEIVALVETIYGRVDWRWAQARAPLIAHGWKPEVGHLKYDWDGYSEAMLVYVLALASPTHSVAPDAWSAWTKTYPRSWGEWYGQQHLGFGPLFAHQYSHVWIDFRGIRDEYMRTKGFDYFENSRRAALAQQAYAIANPMGWKDYSAEIWGLTASDGPADTILDYKGQQRRFWTYAARGAPSPPSYDDGTLAPTAAAGSLPFAPEIVLPTLQAMHRRYGAAIYGQYGFIDSFNPSFQFDVPVQHGRRIGAQGWVNGDYLGIDQGPIVAMIENHRSELVWKLLRKNAHIRRGLRRAGFTGGWLAEVPTTATAPVKR
ncbi:MAG TPA: glucoamylase family protein [Steroidobacteraceae bacterium]|nr:glucoamylase family protein [Steroidobacteraceae bacterium]